MSAPKTEISPTDTTTARPDEAPELPPYSHELSWPEGMAPFKVVDDGTQGDPYAHYEWMRDNAPVLRAHSPVSDVWFISRYDDVRRAMRAPKVFSSQVVDRFR
jgi:cytochrome P450